MTSLGIMVFSRDNLITIKDEAYVINLDDKQSKGTHRVLLFIDRNTVVYFGSFGIDYIPQKVLSKIKDKSITQNIFRNKIMIILCVDFIVSLSKNI